MSWPNQAKTRRALESLDLLVVVDPQVSATARLAHYVLGPRFGFESPAITFGNEGITTYGLSIGYQEPYAQYQPQLIEPPDGSDVLEDWRIFYELARRMGLPLAYRGQPFDMTHAPTTDELLEHFVRRSRVPLELIKQHPHGHLYPDPQPLAEPKEAGWPHRLQLGDPTMLEQLRQSPAHSSVPPPREAATAQRSNRRAGETAPSSLLLVSRREHAVYNSVAHHLPALRRRRPFNPAYVNPADAQRLGARGRQRDRDRILGGSPCTRHCNSPRTCARASCRWRMVSTALAGAGQGASTSALVDDEHDYEPLSGLPRMSAIPVQVRRAATAS